MTEQAVIAGTVPAASPPETRNPFKNGNYRLWWLASVVAGSGVGIQAVTVPLFLKDRVGEDQRGLAIAAALICQTLPAALFVLIGGVVADRVERRRILVRTYAVAAAVSCAYVALSGYGVGVIWPVFILSAVVGSAGAFTNPARQSMTPQILRPSQLQNGVILGTMAFTATLQFGGPTAGGLLADGPGLTVAFGAEVGMLLLAAVLFSRVATDTPIPTGKSVRHDLAEGLRYLKTNQQLQALMLLGCIPAMLLMPPFAVTVVDMVAVELDAGDKFVGILWGCFGAGILVGSFALTLLRFQRRGLLLCCSVLFGGAGMIVYGLSPSLPLSMAVMVVAGALGPAIFANFGMGLLQEITERPMMGRVMSMYQLAFSASLPIGYALAGTLAAVVGTRGTILACASVAAVFGLAAALFLRPIRDLR